MVVSRGGLEVRPAHGLGHLEQLSVVPGAGRRGRGSALMAEVVAWAHSWRAAAVTLSTFRDVAWNAPYYARHGFRVLAEGEVTPGLLVLRSHEVEAGLDVSLRVFMRLDL